MPNVVESERQSEGAEREEVINRVVLSDVQSVCRCMERSSGEQGEPRSR